MSLKYNVKYGWCYSDWKDGKSLGNNFVRRDYVFGHQYGDMVQSVLKEFCLPIPEKDEVYRGCNHDMLFLDSHGISVRIGPLDVESLINPTILQPIGWKSYNNPSYAMYPITVALYPGIELLANYADSEDVVKVAEDFADLLVLSGNVNNDDNNDNKVENIGVIPVKDKDGLVIRVPVLLDMDNNFNIPTDDLENRLAESYNNASEKLSNKADIIGAVIEDVYGREEKLQNNIKGFKVHQSLRRQFWAAYNGNSRPYKNKMEDLLDTCAEMVKANQSTSFPVWSFVDGKFKRDTLKNVNVQLQTPWVRPNKFSADYKIIHKW